jgi:hypothetical protein
MSDLMKRQTAAEMAAAYDHAMSKVDDAYRQLGEAQQLLNGVFGTNHNIDVVDSRVYWGHKSPGEVALAIRKKIKRAAWRRILEGLDLQKVTSQKRYQELQDNLENGELPEISVETIFDTLQSFLQNAGGMQEELMLEVFETLRPRNSKLKTNSRFEVGKRVILTSYVESSYKAWRVNYYQREQALNTLDRAFSLLDGKGVPGGYKGPLVDAINTSQGEGETEYFKFKCCLNGNLHLEFKRLDLLARLNAVCGNGTLRDGRKRR